MGAPPNIFPVRPALSSGCSAAPGICLAGALCAEPTASHLPPQATNPSGATLRVADAAEWGPSSGTFFNALDDGGVYLGVVENGKYYYRHFATWEAIFKNGWYAVGNKGLINVATANQFSGYGETIRDTIMFKRGNPAAGIAACRPGSTIDNILLPRYGNGDRRCNATTSYRCGAGWAATAARPRRAVTSVSPSESASLLL